MATEASFSSILAAEEGSPPTTGQDRRQRWFRMTRVKGRPPAVLPKPHIPYSTSRPKNRLKQTSLCTSMPQMSAIEESLWFAGEEAEQAKLPRPTAAFRYPPHTGSHPASPSSNSYTCVGRDPRESENAIYMQVGDIVKTPDDQTQEAVGVKRKSDQDAVDRVDIDLEEDAYATPGSLSSPETTQEFQPPPVPPARTPESPLTVPDRLRMFAPPPPKLQLQRSQRMEKVSESDSNVSNISTPIPDTREGVPVDQRKAKLWRENKDEFGDRLMHSISIGALREVKDYIAVLGNVSLASKELVDPLLGLSMLQLAIIRRQNGVIDYLIERGGEDLVLLRGETSEYQNVSSLHLAVMNCGHDTWIIEALLGKVDPDRRVAFVNDLLRSSIFEGLPYAELITASVVWAYAGRSEDVEAETLLSILVKNGADLKLRNSNGDTLLHLIVHQSAERPSETQFYRRFVSKIFYRLAGLWVHFVLNQNTKGISTEREHIYGMKQLLLQENMNGLTPLALAAGMECNLFEEMTNLEKVTRFPDYKMGEEFNSVEIYDITDIRSVNFKYEYRKNSVLHNIAHSSLGLAHTDMSHDLIDVEPVRSVVDLKWRVYRWFFYMWGFVHVAYMVSLSWFVLRDSQSFRPPPYNISQDGFVNIASAPNSSSMDARFDKVLLAGYAFWKADLIASIFLCVPTAYIIFELIDLLGNRPYQRIRLTYSNWRLTGNGLYRIQAVLFACLFYTWYVLRLLGTVQQDIFMSLTLVFGWLFIIFFTRTVTFPRGVGAFSIMVQQMLLFDMIPFMIVSAIILSAFSTAFQMLVLRADPKDTPRFSVTFFRIMNYITDLEDRAGYETTRNEVYSKVLITVYAMLTVILMVNMLIAAMNKSYDILRTTKVNLVARQRLSILLLLERRLPRFVRRWSERTFEVVADPFGSGYRMFLKVVINRVNVNYFK